MSTNALREWTSSPFAIAERIDPELLRSEGRVRFLLVRGAREAASLGVIGAIWLSEDGERGGVVPHPAGSLAAADLTRNHHLAMERGWSPARIFEYWRDAADQEWGLEVEPSQTASSLQALANRIDAG